MTHDNTRRAIPTSPCQANYRLLGIGEDAQWGEITDACADLATKYAGDSAKLAQVCAAGRSGEEG